MQKSRKFNFFLNGSNVRKPINENKNIFIKNMFTDGNDGFGIFFVKLEIEILNIF